MVIAHNILAMNAQRQYGVITSDKSKNTEKLSSGYKINRSADDAAGLTISEKMRSQIRGLTQASNNAQDGISFIQIADGALNEVHSMLDRMVELTVQASNGTNTDEDREAIQKEISALTEEINRVHESSEFNTIKTFTDAGYAPDDLDNNAIAATTLKVGNIKYEIEFIGADGNITNATSGASGYDNSNVNQNFADFVVNAASNAVKKISDSYPKLMNGAASDNIKIGLNVANIDGKGNTLASARLEMSYTSSWTQMSYTLNIDKSDYDPSNFDSMTSEQKADLAATIAHEMTHLIMDDTLPSGMLTGNSSSFPKWFKEGMAQTSSGDNGWVSHSLNGSSSDNDISNYMKQVESMPYGAGYLATMALGYEIAKANPAEVSSPQYDSETIKKGLDLLFEEMANQGPTLDSNAALQSISGGKYSSFSDYANKFANASVASDLFDDVKQILDKRGMGAGSLLGSLSDSEASLFGTLDPSGTNYTVDPSNTKFTNSYGSGFPTPASLGRKEDAGGDITLQVGAANRTEQQIALKRFNISSDSLFGYEDVDCSSQGSAKASISIVNDAIGRVSKVRSYYGAMQNRLEHTVKNLDNVVENTQAAESQIRDTDMAAEMVKLTKNNVLAQVSEAMMAQANQSTQGVLSLLM